MDAGPLPSSCPLDGGAPTVKALLDDTVQVVDLLLTTPAIEQNKLVLEDPKNMVPAQQVLPIINNVAVPDSAAECSNRVSAIADHCRFAYPERPLQEPAQAGYLVDEHGF